MLLPGNNRELFLIGKENKSDVMLEEFNVQNIIVIDEGVKGIVAEHIFCIDIREAVTFNIFDLKKGKWMFEPSTDSLELAKYS